MATRTIRKYFRTPQLIVLSTGQSALFLVLFRYVFGGAVDVGAQSYFDFLVPGFVTTVILWAGMGSAAGVAEEVQPGLYDRLRSLPIPRASVIAGRWLADTILVVWGLAVATGLGFAVGYRLDGSVTDGLTAFGLCALFGFAFTWVFITIGLLAGNAQAAQGFTLLVVPFTFVSSAYVPTSSMPGWLQAVADNQPVTSMVNAVRSLSGGPQAEALFTHDTSYYVGLSLIWTTAIVLRCTRSRRPELGTARQAHRTYWCANRARRRWPPTPDVRVRAAPLGQPSSADRLHGVPGAGGRGWPSA